MKYFLFSILLISAYKGAVAQQTEGEKVSAYIAQKMKDSLRLSDAQKDSVYIINMQLQDKKSNSRRQYSTTELQGYFQSIENTRDSLYQIVLPHDKYLLYKEKKNILISAN